MATLASFGLSVALFFFLWASWSVFLGGTAALQTACDSTLNRWAVYPYDILGYQTMYIPWDPRYTNVKLNSKVCRTLQSLPWWIVSFEFFCLALAVLSAISPAISKRMFKATMYFLAINTTLLMVLSTNFNTAIAEWSGQLWTHYEPGSTNYITAPTRSKTSDGTDASYAGAIGLMVFNGLYILSASSKVSWLVPNLTLPGRGKETPLPVVATLPHEEVGTAN